MHTDKINERRGLSKLVGLAVAGATLLAGMVALPATQASAISGPDGFEPGAVSGTVPTLTVTKYLSSNPGANPTGSVDDLTTAQASGTPAQGIAFNVFEVIEAATPGATIANINPNDNTSYRLAPGGVNAAGITDGSGVISNWQEADATGAPNGTAVTFPAGVHYYILKENRAVSPAFISGNIDPARYANSAPAFFGLPYKTKDAMNRTGYIYNLHIYPKNVSTSSLDKSVTAINGSTDAHVARAGDIISYKVTQKLYNQGSASSLNDGKLDVAELAGGYNDLRIVDRMGSSLTFQPTSVHASVTWQGSTAPLALTQNTDWRVRGPQPGKFQRIVNGDDMFNSDPAGIAKYTAFEFFDNITALKASLAAIPSTELTLVVTYDAKVTADGDSTSTGGVSNAVESDFVDNRNGGGPLPPPGGGTTTPSGTLAFGKVQKASGGATGNVPVQGAVFRLSDLTDGAKFLATDGNTYAEGDLPGGQSFYSATSSPTGSVVFTGLPIVDRTTHKGIEGNWSVVEYSAPAGLDPAPNPFPKVSFDENVVGKTESEIVAHYGSNPIQPVYSQLNFGRYSGAAPASPIKFHGEDVKANMMNWSRTDPDSPVNLPLTGGRGIILLLVAGVVIMGGALYIRSRRNAARA